MRMYKPKHMKKDPHEALWDRIVNWFASLIDKTDELLDKLEAKISDWADKIAEKIGELK